MKTTTLHQLWPLLGVRDLQRSLGFYRDRLGFRVADRDAGTDAALRWCRLERDGVSLMLQQDDAPGAAGERRGSRVVLYLVCDDVEPLQGELRKRGLDVSPPSTAYYGMRQLELRDPDGFVICFESPTDDWRERQRPGS